MIILRKKIKSFADPSSQQQQQPQSQPGEGDKQLTPAELAKENMMMQRQIMQNQRLREKIQAQQTRERASMIKNARKNEEERDAQAAKNQIKVKKMEQERDEAKNVNLYKRPSTASKDKLIVSMK